MSAFISAHAAPRLSGTRGHSKLLHVLDVVACERARVCPHTQTQTHTHTSTHTPTRTHAHTHTRTHAHTHTRTPAHPHAPAQTSHALRSTQPWPT